MAIFLLDAEAERFAHTILEAPRAAISAANLLEAGIILDAGIGHADSSELDEFIASVGLEVEPVTADQARLARQACRIYGRGNHPAGLNFGDWLRVRSSQNDRGASAIQGRRLHPDGCHRAV